MRYHADNLAAWWADRQKADNIEWTRISAEMGEWLRGLAYRDDLLAVVEPGTGKGHPAVYIPEMAHVEVNPDVCAPGIDPHDVRMDTEVGRLASAAFAGAGAHEGAHAAFSRWRIDQSPAKRAVVQAALLLEEARAEMHLVQRHPHLLVLLRATFATIVGAAPDDMDSPAAAAHTLALAAARADAGILSAEEVAPIVARGITVLGQDRFDALRGIWMEALALPDHDDAEAMEALGRRWLDVLGDDAQDGGDGEPQFVCGDPHEGGEGAGGPLSQIADGVAEAAQEEAGDQVDAARIRDEVDARKKAAREADKDERAARNVFEKPIEYIGHGHGYGYGREGIASHRPPTARERAEANVLARSLERARYRDRTKTVVASAMPPGRLRSTVAVRRSAERSMGLMATAKPWRQTVRRRVENPPLRVALACDISGSMAAATRHVASLAWTIANAVHRVEGDSVTVAYGDRVHAVVRPGESPSVVRDFNADGGMENMSGALRAMNGALRLDSSPGVRMVVVISDGHYTHRQRQDGDMLAKRLARSGVMIMHIGFDGPRNDKPLAGAHYVHLSDPAQMGRIVGDAMVRMLERA